MFSVPLLHQKLSMGQIFFVFLKMDDQARLLLFFFSLKILFNKLAICLFQGLNLKSHIV